MKRRIWLGIGLLVAIFVVSILTFTFKGYQDAKHLKDSLNRGDKTTVIQSAGKVRADLNSLITLSKMPVVSQIFGAVDLNFNEIRPELDSLFGAMPYVAGVDKPKNYLLAFQNSAEARGTGGILGAYAIINVDKGNLKITKTGSNASLASLAEIPVPVTEEFLRLYGKNPAILQNSNLSPHFPYGAEIWMGLWKRQTGQNLDGVIAIDPEALSYVLRATGPIQVDGVTIDSKNIVQETLKDAYKRYETNNDARKQHLVNLINATAKNLISGNYSKLEMARAIRDGLKSGRILFYSTDKNAEKYLAASRIGGYMSKSANNEYRVVIQNIDASKLDYYLKRSVKIDNLVCKPTKKSTVYVTVTNTLQSGKGLPAYVLTRADKNKPDNLVTGAHRFKVFIYGPVGSKIVSAWRENLKQGIGGQAKERGRPVMVMDLDLKPMQSEKLFVNFEGGGGKISFVDQPLVIPTELSVKESCLGSAS